MQAHNLYFRWLETLGLVANVGLKTFPRLRRERSCAFFRATKTRSLADLDGFLGFPFPKNAQELLATQAKLSPRCGTLN